MGKRSWAAVAVLAAATFAAFSPVLGNGFVSFDDEGYITRNRNVLSGLTRQGLAWAFTSTSESNWHPLTWLSHMLDVSLFGLHPAGHHFTSVLLHALNIILLFLLLKETTGAFWKSAAVGLLFGVHPLRVQSVAWAAERKDVLSTFFFLLALVAYRSYLRKRGAARYVVMTALFALGLMSKPMLVTFPFVLLLLDFWPLDRVRFGRFHPPRGSDLWRRQLLLVLEKAPLFVLAAASGYVTHSIQLAGGRIEFLHLSFWMRTGNACLSYLKYLSKHFWPGGLTFFSAHPAGDLPLWGIALAAVTLAAITGACLASIRKRPYLLTGWLWYLGTLIPVIGIIQVGAQAMADRYTYIPLIGISLLLVWAGEELASRLRLDKTVICAGAAAAALVLMFLTMTNTRFWRDDPTLYAHALEISEDNWMAHALYGKYLADQRQPQEAIFHYLAALKLQPHYETYLNLGVAYGQLGRWREAAQAYSRSIAIMDDARTRFNLGMAYLQLRQMKAAWAEYAVLKKQDAQLAEMLRKILSYQDAANADNPAR